jgi:predicted PurR-regulated permease PerM
MIAGKPDQLLHGRTNPTPGRTTSPSAEFARRVVAAVLITLTLVILAAIAWRGIHVLLEAFAGVLFGLFLSALADWLHQKTRLRYGWSLAVVLVVLVVLIAGGCWLLASRMAIQLRDLVKELPATLDNLEKYLQEHPPGRVIIEVTHAEKPSAWAGALLHGGAVFSNVLEFSEAVIVILVVGIFGAAEPDVYKAGLFHLVPRRHRDRAGQAVDAVTFNLRHWLVGQVVLMIVMAVTTAITLTLLGIPFALALGTIVGVMEIIPYLGAWLSAIPAALIALTVSPFHLVMVLILFLALHVLEGYVLLPLIQRRAVHLPPALTLVVQVLLGELLGILGLFVAAPLTVVGVVLVKMLYIEDTLGDQEVNVPGEPGNADGSTAQAG